MIKAEMEGKVVEVDSSGDPCESSELEGSQELSEEEDDTTKVWGPRNSIRVRDRGGGF